MWKTSKNKEKMTWGEKCAQVGVFDMVESFKKMCEETENKD